MPVLQQHPSLHFREWTEAVSLQWLYATPRVLALALPRAAAGAPLAVALFACSCCLTLLLHAAAWCHNKLTHRMGSGDGWQPSW
jgi:fatty-acid desaturase